MSYCCPVDPESGTYKLASPARTSRKLQELKLQQASLPEVVCTVHHLIHPFLAPLPVVAKHGIKTPSHQLLLLHQHCHGHLLARHSLRPALGGMECKREVEATIDLTDLDAESPARDTPSTPPPPDVAIPDDHRCAKRARLEGQLGGQLEGVQLGSEEGQPGAFQQPHHHHTSGHQPQHTAPRQPYPPGPNAVEEELRRASPAVARCAGWIGHCKLYVGVGGLIRRMTKYVGY